MTRRLFIISLLLTLCLGLEARPWMLLFGTPDCEECAKLKNHWIMQYDNPDDPALVFLNVEKYENYRFLNQVEKALDLKEAPASFPVLLLGRQLKSGVQAFYDVMENLSEHLRDVPSDLPLRDMIQAAVDRQPDAPMISLDIPADSLETSAPSQPDTASPPDDTPAAKSSPCELIFFRQPGCHKCSRQTHELNLLKNVFPDLKVSEFDITTLEGQAMLTRVRNYFGLPEDDHNLVPMVVWLDGYATGRLARADELSQKLKDVSGKQLPAFWHSPLTEDELNHEGRRLSNFMNVVSWPAVISGGLADGVNPCAFATSIFLISYLIYLKRRRYEIIIVGLLFCIGVFITYFCYGLALSYLLDLLKRWSWIKTLLFGGFGIAGLVLAYLHLRDALRYRKSGQIHDMDMGLSKESHRNIHAKIRAFTRINSVLMAPAALILGIVVSSMELACTGQIYLSVLAAISGHGLTPRFLLLLSVYNLCFIIPLVIITCLAAYGVGAKPLEAWAKRNVFTTKLLMAAMFALLSCIMFAMLLFF